jgi:hypothetical protein
MKLSVSSIYFACLILVFLLSLYCRVASPVPFIRYRNEYIPLSKDLRLYCTTESTVPICIAVISKEPVQCAYFTDVSAVPIWNRCIHHILHLQECGDPQLLFIEYNRNCAVSRMKIA